MDTDEVMIKCYKCEKLTPESELLQVKAWWVCGICHDEYVAFVMMISNG